MRDSPKATQLEAACFSRHHPLPIRINSEADEQTILSLSSCWNPITHSCQQRRALHSSPERTGEVLGEGGPALALIIESCCQERHN